jgi:hypothetical protein
VDELLLLARVDIERLRFLKHLGLVSHRHPEVLASSASLEGRRPGRLSAVHASRLPARCCASHGSRLRMTELGRVAEGVVPARAPGVLMPAASSEAFRNARGFASARI